MLLLSRYLRPLHRVGKIQLKKKKKNKQKIIVEELGMMTLRSKSFVHCWLLSHMSGIKSFRIVL